jgi:hypothetical protein
MINAELLDSAVLSRLDQPCRDAERALEGLEDAAVGIDAKIEETQGAITTIVTGPRWPLRRARMRTHEPRSVDVLQPTDGAAAEGRRGTWRRSSNSATPSNRHSSTYLLQTRMWARPAGSFGTSGGSGNTSSTYSQINVESMTAVLSCTSSAPRPSD